MIDSPVTSPQLQALPYHRAMVEWLRREEPGVWSWHAKTRQSQERVEAVRLELLKSTYRLDRAAHAGLYEQLDRIALHLGVRVPLTCYQAQAVSGALNAGLIFVPDEAHILLQGPVLSALEPSEIACVLAHELGHHRLWTCDDGAYGIADRILESSLSQGQPEPSLINTVRRWRLSTELFADRASLSATGDLAAVVRTLVRVETGGAEVNADSYLAQAAEILAKGQIKAEGITHPECFIRAAALAACHRRAADLDATIDTLVVGPLDPGDLDVLGQQRCAELTRQVLATALTRPWMRSDAVMAHAQQFFLDLEPGGDPAALDQALGGATPGLRDYVCLLLLDLAAADRDLGEVAIAYGLDFTQRWGWAERFAELAQRDLKLKNKDLIRLKQQAAALIAAADAKQAPA